MSATRVRWSAMRVLLRGQSRTWHGHSPVGASVVTGAVGVGGIGVPAAVVVAVDIPAGYPRADAREDFVRVSTRPIGPLAHRRLAAVARSEQDDLVAHLRRQIADVDDKLIHRNAAGDRMAAAPQPDLGRARRVSGYAVG